MCGQSNYIVKSDLLVVLTPRNGYEIDKSYALSFGAASNTKCGILRRTSYNNFTGGESEEVSGRVLDPGGFRKYWVSLTAEGRASMGVESLPIKDFNLASHSPNAGGGLPFHGRNTILTFEDHVHAALRPPSDAVKFVGIGNNQPKGGKKGQAEGPCQVRKLEVRFLTPWDVIDPVRGKEEKL